MIETRSEHSDRKWAEVAAATLDGLTGTFGGVIGYTISTYLTTDPEVIAASTQFGDTAFTVVGIIADVDPVTGEAKKGKQSPTRKGRSGARLVREAYRNGKRIKTQAAEETRVKIQGEADGILIEMYVNLDTKTIVTAYPTTEDRR